MFTTLQLLHRLARRTRVPDIAELSMSDRLELVDAANHGLVEFTQHLPPDRTQSPASATLRAPLTLQISILTAARGFSYVSGTPYPTGGYATEEDLVGHSVSVAGDGRLNQLHRPGELLSGYMGSGGTVNAIFYADAAQMGTEDRRIITPPVWTTTTSKRHLVHLGDPRRRWHDYPFQGHDIEVGEPEYWWTEPLLGWERVTTPLWLLRVWPLPSTAGTLTYILDSWPQAITLEDFTTARELPLPEREVPAFVALCLEGLLGSPLLHPDVTGVAEQSRAARARLQGQHQPRHSEPQSVGTAAGY